MLEIGSIVGGKYKILHQVGKGGMSYVYLAINEAANREWAVKEVRTGNRDGIRQDPAAETEILKKLNNPHLPRIVDIIPGEDSFLIVMDYIEGITLKSLLKNEGRQSQENVVCWALQLCDVLEYLHSQDPPVIYRDMKPGNLMLKPDGTVMLIDFGIAREYREGAEEDTVCLGTKGYAAPEQYGGRGQTDERTDIYNLGATLYHLVTGKDPSRPPYEIRPIRSWDPALSTGLEKILMKCTRNDPEKRYQSVSEVRFELEHYRELEEEYQSRKEKKRRVFRGLCAAAALSLLCSLGTGFRARMVINGTYEEKIRRAETSTTPEDSASAYEDAILTDPLKIKAYSGLLNSVFLADGIFSQKEAEELLRILGCRESGSARTVEEQFRKNRAGYEEFCYEAGLAFFYFYEGSGNKPLSRAWLGTAAQSSSLDEKKRMRAERLYSISGYYMQLGRTDKAGDSTADYAEYWNDLTRLSGDSIAEEDNIRTALVMYGELVYQIGTHTDEFGTAGITKAEMLYELKRVERIITEEIIGTEGYTEEEYGEKTDEILAGISAARRAVETVFSQEESR